MGSDPSSRRSEIGRQPLFSQRLYQYSGSSGLNVCGAGSGAAFVSRNAFAWIVLVVVAVVVFFFVVAAVLEVAVDLAMRTVEPLIGDLLGAAAAAAAPPATRAVFAGDDVDVDDFDVDVDEERLDSALTC